MQLPFSSTTAEAIRPKAVYFFYFAALSAFAPFISLWYDTLGLSRSAIGLLTGLVPLVSIVSAPLWGAFADARQRHRAALLLAATGAMVAALLLSLPRTVATLLPVVLLYAFCAAPLAPLLDNAVLTWLGARRALYGNIRVWGSVGWMVVTLFIGRLIANDLRPIFFLFALLMAAALVVAWRMPFASRPASRSWLNSMRLLLANRRFLFFILIVLVQGMALSVFLTYLFLHMEALGGQRTLMAYSLTTATLSEIPLWFMTAWLLRRWGADRMLALSLLLMAVRGVIYMLMPAAWWVVPVNLLHGPIFAMMYSAGVTLADESAPEGLGATAQGLFNASVFGLGAALGAFLGGPVADAWGLPVLFGLTGAVVLAALLLFVWVRREALLRPL
jgi:PPP family 3-phenylpropionic acid transporter